MLNISSKAMGGWMAQMRGAARSFVPADEEGIVRFQGDRHRRYQRESAGPKTSVCADWANWPYVGDIHHPVIIYDYTPTRGRAGPAKFLEGYTGYLQADAYSVYDAFFKPERGLVEVGCWMHARRYLIKALETDEEHMGPALHLIARLYRVEERAKALSLSAKQRLELRQRVSSRLIDKLHRYLLKLQQEVSAEEPLWRGRALCIESVAGADTLSRRRRVGDRQWHHRARQSGYRDRSRQLDILRQ